ncbi:MAG: hypothetical protein KatS3mg102_1635 [Planctomycetota bacterium]|nr:MAG: hypothetical protein KatS3mg102_1635 [Planctomycetota bacterium]
MQGFDMQALGEIFKQAHDMHRKLHQLKLDLKERIVEASAGGGLVTAQANGIGELLALRIQREAVDPDDVEMLEDLVVAAVNEALKKALALHHDELRRLRLELGLPAELF